MANRFSLLRRAMRSKWITWMDVDRFESDFVFFFWLKFFTIQLFLACRNFILLSFSRCPSHSFAFHYATANARPRLMIPRVSSDCYGLMYWLIRQMERQQRSGALLWAGSWQWPGAYIFMLCHFVDHRMKIYGSSYCWAVRGKGLDSGWKPHRRWKSD